MTIRSLLHTAVFFFLILGTVRAQNTSLWFGYYQEDAGNNPEDPMIGMLYAHLPGNGEFSGEMIFSYAGCEGGMQRGRVSGRVQDSSIDGTWSGVVDGTKVGGAFSGTRNVGGNAYNGVYTNREGKKKIECQGLTYHVAAKGTWKLHGAMASAGMDIQITVDAQADQVSFEWTDFDYLDVYRFVVVDKQCLEDEQDLEKCMVWNGEYGFSDIMYGEEFDDIPQAKPLELGKTYVIYVSAFNEDGSILGSIAKEFRYQ